MPKATTFCLIWVPESGTYKLLDQHHEQTLPIVPDTQQWFAWLTTISSFSFIGQHGQLTVRLEARSQGGVYWYAYRRAGRKMRKRYLSRTTDLTLSRLEEIALQLTVPSVSHNDHERLINHPLQEDIRVQAGASALHSLAHEGDSHVEDSPPATSVTEHSFAFATKFSVPRLRAKLVRRTRLLERLQWGREARLILVSAPAGFGKTTLLVQWLSEIDLPVVWMPLEQEDN